jgi:IS605 OrfB family transposase
VTKGQRRRCFALLRGGADVWAALIELNRLRLRRGVPPLANYQALCREVAGVAVGELSVTAIRSVLRRYSDAFFETARRRRGGERAHYPRRRRALFPLRWYAGTFVIDANRVKLSVAKGAPELRVRLSRPLPYPAEAVRSVTLVADAGRLCLDVTAAVEVEDHGLDPARVAGVDLGIIHPFAVASGDEALLVSGRALRAEERLHLEDTKRRAKKMGRRAPKRGQRGSRRWRRLRTAQRRAEARHRARITQAQHRAAKEVVAWALARGVGTLAVGDPAGICNNDAGRHQNLRLRQWRRTRLLRALIDKAALAGMAVVLLDERGTSSTCPQCQRRVPPVRGRTLSCPHCGHVGHRDVVGARNIAGRAGGTTTVPAVVTHRRAGAPPARRDRRRHLYDLRRSGPAPGRPGRRPGSRSLGSRPEAGRPVPGAARASRSLAPGEDRGDRDAVPMTSAKVH